MATSVFQDGSGNQVTVDDRYAGYWASKGWTFVGPAPALFSGAINLNQLNISSASDIGPVLDQAEALSKRIVVPYRAQPWPLLTTWVASGVELWFEAGARISLDMPNTPGMTLTGCKLINASFTSIFTGPASAGDYANYGFPAREIKLNSDCEVMGSYYQEYGATGIHVNGSHVKIGNTKFKNVRHRTGWAACIHIEGSNSWDISVGHLQVEDCDRAVEIEAAAHDITFYAGGYLKNVYPNGYTGQPANTSNADAAVYANYTAVLDGHTHSGEGGVANISFDGEWFLENCGSGVNFSRATGTNDSDLPRNCRAETVHFRGRNLASGAEQILLEGYSCGVDKVHMELGAGVTSGARYRVLMQNGSGAFINDFFAEAFSLPMIEAKSTMSNPSIGVVRALDGKIDGTAYLIDIAAPYAKIDKVDALAVGGTQGYVRLQATADFSDVRSMNFTKKAGETFVDFVVDLSANSKVGQRPAAPMLAATLGRSGKVFPLSNRAIGANQCSNQTLRLAPIFFPFPLLIDQLGTEITAIGDVGSIMRLGIFENLQGLPGDPLCDVTVAADAVAIPMATLGTPLFLPPGWYHAGGVPQNSPVQAPTVRTLTAGPEEFIIYGPSTTAVVPVGYSKGSISGALAAFGTSISTTNIAPRLWARSAN